MCNSEVSPTRSPALRLHLFGPSSNALSIMAKRRNQDEATGDEGERTPRKSRRIAHEEETITPTPRRSVQRDTPSKANGTPSSLRKVLFFASAGGQGSNRAEGDEETSDSVTVSRNDRSAKRKSARRLQKEDSSEDEDVGETAVAEAILDGDDAQLSGEEEYRVDTINAVDEDIVVAASNTPSKRGRGRPKGRPKRERTPSPPPDLPPHELYFFQNRTGANKTSSNTLPTNLLLNHDDYLANVRAYVDPHSQDVDRLKRLHTRSLDQWRFELDEGFNICLYGYGSKRDLAMEFASHLSRHSAKGAKIIIVNGYTPELTIKDILSTVTSTLSLPKNTTLPAQSPALLSFLLGHLTDYPPKIPLTLVMHSIDAPSLRKAHTMLAQLAAHPSVSLIATADTPHFPLLFTTSVQRQYNFLFHDATTFQPYDVEIDVGEQVDLLLGRSGRGGRGKDGVVFVLRSLPENAKNLFNILLVELLSSMKDGSITAQGFVDGDNDIDDDDILGASDDEAALTADTPSRRGRGRPPKKPATPKKPKHFTSATQPVVGIEYRSLYHKAVEAFVCSSELNFRTLLKEFHDHRMVESHRDAAGVERLFVPGMGKLELEMLLEEIG